MTVIFSTWRHKMGCKASSIHIILTSLILPMLVVTSVASPAMAEGNGTIVGTLDLVSTFECISVYSNFSDDDNGNNQAILEYREVGGSWIQGMALTVDRRAQIISNRVYIDNPYCNQWRGSISGLSPDTDYEVRITYTDIDGINGSNSVEGSITTRDENIPIDTGTTYYVATGGNDANLGTTEEQPWATIQHAADNVAAGDTVLIKAGTYHGGQIWVKCSGTPDAYISFRPYGTDNVILDGDNANELLIFANASYLHFKGLKLRNISKTVISLSDRSDYNVIEDCIIEDFGFSVPDAGIDIGSGSAYNVIQRNNISSARNSHSDEMHREDGICFWKGHWRPEITTYGPGEGNIIRYNTITAINGGISDGIGGNENHKLKDGPYKDADIYGNIISTNDDGIEAEGGNINVRVWGNKIITSNYSGIAYAPVVVGPLYVFRNEIYDLQQTTCKVGQNIPSGLDVSYNGAAYIYHNTAYAAQSALYGYGVMPWGGPYWANNHYRNNIIQVQRRAYDIPSQAAAAPGNDWDYDNLYNGGSSEIVRWCGTNYPTLASFQAASGQETHGISQDSEFVDPANGDLTLQSTSPCIDKGEPLIGFNDENSPWPYSGSAPDIGAYEYNSGPVVDNTPPYTTGHNPANGAVGRPRNTNIVVHVKDDGDGVDQSSIVMMVEGTTVTPTITGTPADYTLTYNPPSNFNYEQVVDVTVDAQDLASPPNTMTQDAYSFTIASLTVDSTPPYTTGHNPADGAVGIARNTDIVVHVEDDGDGVDQSSIVMTVEGAAVTPTITGTPADYTLTYNSPSDFDYEQVVDVTVDAQDLASPPNTMTQDAYSFTIAVDNGQWPYLPVRVNCAGVDYTDGSSNIWKADQAYVSGSWGFYGDDNPVDRGTGLAISGTADDRIYQTERYGLDGYRFDLGNGTYDVYLHFAETYHNSVGARVFDVSIEGQLVLDNLDIYDEVGGNAALIKTINNVNVTDGQLTITFTQITENPLINGIMIADAAGNQPPVALNDSYSVAVDGTLNIPSPGVLSNDSDGDSDPLTAILVSDVSHGSLTFNSNGSFTYSPDPGYTGTDSFTYRANDGQENSNTATVTITLNPFNSIPVAVDDAYSVDEDNVLNVGAPGVLSNDTDADSDPLTTTLISDVSHGSLTLNSNGSFTYTPDPGYTGTDSFTYRANDGQEHSNTATVTITVSSGNQAPVLNSIGNKSVNEGETLEFTVSASDPDNDPLTYSASNLPSGASFNPGTRTFSWITSSGQSGTYSYVHFEVSDGELTDSEEITIDVNRRSSSSGGGGGGGSAPPSNKEPVLNTIGNKLVCGGQLLEFTVSATDPDDDTLTYSANLTSLPPEASFDPETRTFSWAPSSEQAGSYPGVYFEVSDGKLADSEEITITVNNPPVLDTIGDKVATEEELFEFTISATDPDDDPLTYSACNLPSGASFDADTQTFSWTPDPGQEGNYSNVHFEVSDGSLIGFEEITVTVHKADKIPPEIGEVVASEINPDSVEIYWTTDEPSTSQVKYWASPSKVTPLDETLVTHHVVRLTNLVPGTTYYYMTLSRDEKGNIAVSPTYTFTTPVRPVTFTISELNITPAKANIGEEITISVLVTNTSDVTRDYEVTLYVDDVAEDSKQIVDLAGGASQRITFTTVKNTAVPFMLIVNGANGSLVVEEEAGATEEINFIKVNPRFSIETGKLDSARVRYQVAKFNASMADVELVLVVNLDGKPFETVSLPLSSQLEPDGIMGIFDYTPSQRWRSGTYTFQALLYEGERLLESTNVDNLEVMPEFVVEEVEWVTLGQIIGAALVVIAVTLLYVLYRRRRMLKGYIEDA